MRLINLLLALCLLALAACASSSPGANALDTVQYAWSGAIRWGDFAGAGNLVDPDVREAKATTELEMKRYDQVQVSSYRVVGSSRDIESGTAVRDVEIGVINRHTMAERTVKYSERWRWDETAGTWWNTGGLPDLWAE